MNNYASISFNFGPTLLDWLKGTAPAVYASILEADRKSQERFSGHASAISQAYNHVIMPLANRRDKVTQVAWGIADFQHRFGRKPRGMWLPETAVDAETLEVLAEQGIGFTILAPHQAKEVLVPGQDWGPAQEEKLNGAYRLQLPTGKTIALFFYNGPVSRAVAFDGVLRKGEDFAHKLLGAFPGGEGGQLVNIASDGETYGHHHRHGDMALAYALYHIDTHQDADITNYSEYLDHHPPEVEVRIHEDTSWSCVHGLERWRSDCGCSTGGQRGWHQKWRGPLREALDWLRDELAPRYERMAGELLKDPWRARDEYVHVILDRREERVQQFLRDHALRPLARDDEVRVLKLLELQRHALLMYTSCGWFFNDISGIETVQVLQYAGRCLQLVRDLLSEDLENGFLERLERAPSNIPGQGNGRRIYESMVRPAMVDLPKVVAHYALNSLFSDYPETARVYSYTVQKRGYHRLESGGDALAVGWCRVSSTITLESEDLAFAAVSLRTHDLKCGVRPLGGKESHTSLVKELRAAFRRADLPKVLDILDSEFGGSTYSMSSLFREEQRAILDRILDRSMDESAAAYRWIYRNQAPLMRLLKDNGVTLPQAFTEAAEFVINLDLRTALEGEVPDLDRAQDLMGEVQEWGVELEMARLNFTLEGTLDRTATQFRMKPDSDNLRSLGQLVEFCKTLPFDVDLRHAQNACFQVLRGPFRDIREKADSGVQEAAEWVGSFLELTGGLHLKVE